MTNEQIILNESIELMKNGKIGKTGKQIEIEIEDLNGKRKVVLDEPEPIHTFQAWKNLGFCVKKGEKAVAQFCIWKCVNKKVKMGDDEETEEQKRMFMKKASFFSLSQVQALN